MVCRHCYLNQLSYLPEKDFISDTVLEKMLQPRFLTGIQRVIIVGKEPLYNKKSRAILEKLVVALTPLGIQVEIITNGLNLNLLDTFVLRRLTEVNVSLDGGPSTYAEYRGNVILGKNSHDIYAEILNNIRNVSASTQVNILHTLSPLTRDVDDMMHVETVHPQKILFSPFVKTSDVSDATMVELGMTEMLEILAGSNAFIKSPVSRFVVGTHSSRGMSREEIRGMVQSFNLTGKVGWIGDSSEFVRITFDGMVIDSKSALTPSSYQNSSIPIERLGCIQDFKPTERR